MTLPCADRTSADAMPGVPDRRPAVAELLAAYRPLLAAGWHEFLLATQAPALPILAYASGPRAERIVIAGIHGREPAGAIALARQVALLIASARQRPLLVLPLLNPWGYAHHERYSPTGQSVSDSDHLLGRAAVPACAEAAAITDYLLHRADLAPQAAVLDLHEDPIYEAPGYRFEGNGSYFYIAGHAASNDPLTKRIRHYLAQCSLPLVRNGITRFGETLSEGAIVDSADGSVDELLATRCGCTPVLTTELVLRAPESPPLTQRIEIYRELIARFLAD